MTLASRPLPVRDRSMRVLTPADQPSTGRLVIVSGPSGSGKTTLLERLYEQCPLPLVASISATTRPKRQGETEGRHYHFLTREEFARRRDAGEFLECCEVHQNGDWYGTLKSEVAPRLAEGRWVVLEIDVQGARAVLQHYPQAITMFVRLHSLEELERRLRKRGTESEEAIQRRLASAQRELASLAMYQFEIINDDMDQAVQTMCQRLLQCEGKDK
jgi:guanylate kinase